ncbi:MAG TPA: SxtJ family membrane protein [Mucilaginibacter sp.]|jgi:hypothetical protein|nr:SxtJ family membrane protein [Mucilaginibacter sp.]
MSRSTKIFAGVTKLQTVEFAQVAIFVLISLGLYYKNHSCITAALIVTIVGLIVPKVFYPFAVAWFGLSKILSAGSSKILMGFVFMIIVVPTGLFRKLTGKDGLKLCQFKKSRQSVMADRNHTYEAADFLNTF